MTAVQQKTVDGYHTLVIALIYKRRKLEKFNTGNQTEWEAITTEIEKVEEERREYEKSCKI